MQVTETLNEGLKREIAVVVPAEDMMAKRDEKLVELKNQVKINGFRPGKVPLAHVAKLYGKSVMGELVNETIDTETKKTLSERNEKAAQQPKISMTEDEAEAEAILDGKKDFEFKIEYEVIPPFEISGFDKLKIERPVVEVSDEEIMEQVERIAESNATYSEKKGKAAKKDRVTMDYVGKVDGEAFEGGADENANLVLGSESFIPGFEDQLIGANVTLKNVETSGKIVTGKGAGVAIEFALKIVEIFKGKELANDLARKMIAV